MRRAVPCGLVLHDRMGSMKKHHRLRDGGRRGRAHATVLVPAMLFNVLLVPLIPCEDGGMPLTGKVLCLHHEDDTGAFGEAGGNHELPMETGSTDHCHCVCHLPFIHSPASIGETLEKDDVSSSIPVGLAEGNPAAIFHPPRSC